MREYPVFIPDGQDHVAAVLTVPEDEPRGLVVLVTGGGGAPRSQRSSMFTKAARGLAERDIASIRLDAKGIGDSTGVAAFSLTHPPVEPTINVARFAVRATGIGVLGMAGNCGGARTSVEVIRRLPEMQSAVLMFVKPLAVARSRRPAVLAAKAMVRRIPGVGKVVKKGYWLARSRRAAPVVQALRSIVGRVDLLLLEADTEKAGKLLHGGYGLKATGARRFEIRQLPGGSRRAFRSPDRQAYTVESLVAWFDQTFPRPPVKAVEPLTARGETSRAP